MAPGVSESSIVRFDTFELDLKNQELRKSGRPHKLERRAFQVLSLLARRPNELVTREAIYKQVWEGDKAATDILGERLDFHIRAIRAALGDSPKNPRYIQTVRGLGYKFVGVVEVLGRPFAPRAAAVPPEVKASKAVTPSEQGGRRQSSSVTSSRRVPILLLAAAVSVAAIAVLAVILILSDAGVSEVSFEGNQLLARHNGKLMWSYPFDQPIDVSRVMTPEDVEERVKIVDLKGDGRKEVLVAAPQLLYHGGNNSTDTDALYCFTSRGKLMWKHEFRDAVSFGGEGCGPRWEICSLLVSHDGPKPSIWCSICSFPMSASVLYHFAATGQATPYFVNYGHIHPLSEMRTPTGSYLMAGGINNECNCAMLAVLKADLPSGHSPETEPSKATCQGCPLGQPYRYLLFPRSEVNQVLGPACNQISRIAPNANGVEAMTDELGVGSNGRLSGSDWTLYKLSLDFRPLSAIFSDDYWEDHKRLSGEGRIKHSVEDCPERLKPITVRVWSPEDGWSRVELPPVAPRNAKQ